MRRHGSIINLASTAAFQPMPEMAVYAAAKGYVLQFSVGLREELLGTGVRVMALCPDPTHTHFFENAGNDNILRKRREPEQVVETAFKGLRAGQPFVIDGALNTVMALSNRFAPRRVSAKVAPLVMKYM